MKVKLLNDDGYAGMENVNFPIEVEAEVSGSGYASIPESELHRIGCSDAFWDPDDPFWPFGPSSWEVVE